MDIVRRFVVCTLASSCGTTHELKTFRVVIYTLSMLSIYPKPSVQRFRVELLVPE